MIDRPELEQALRRVLDPEVGVNIVDLGLVYAATREGDNVRVDLTLTSPACPLGETVIRDARAALRDAGYACVCSTTGWAPSRAPHVDTGDAFRTRGWRCGRSIPLTSAARSGG